MAARTPVSPETPAPETPARRVRTEGELLMETPLVAMDHTPVLHITDSMPLPKGTVPVALHAKSLECQRKMALGFYKFLIATEPPPPLLKLNEGSNYFVALVNVPKTCKVKVVFCPGMGSSPIGEEPSAIDDHLLFLHGDGSQELGPPLPLSFSSAAANQKEVSVLTEAQFTATVTAKGENYPYPLVASRYITEKKLLMKLAPIPAYFVYDGFHHDLNAGLVYERLMKHNNVENDMFTYLKHFLRGCISGQPGGGPRPYLKEDVFSSPPSAEARLWAKRKFIECFPSLHPTVVDDEASGGLYLSSPKSGLNPEITAFLKAFTAKVTPDSSPTATPTKVDEKSTMSAGELEVTLEMCGQPRDGDLSMLPQWFQDCAAKGTSEQYQLTIIRKWMMNNCYYDDADIPMTATLLKMIRKRAWCGTDGNISRPSLVNAMEGLSPFAMQDMDEDAVAHFNDENALLDSASLVSVADIRALRKKVKLSVPTEAEEFMLILKRFANLLYALFSARCPLFRCTQEVIIAIKAFSREARRTMSQATKASILWIGLLQARQFALGEMQILFEYTQMHQDLRAKKSCIHHGEVPAELVNTTTNKRQTENDEGSGNPKRPKPASNPNTWNSKLRKALVQPMRVAGNPSFTKVMQFCKCDAYKMLPKANNICVPNMFLGRCYHAAKCQKEHNIATDDEATEIIKMLDAFIKDPAKIKAGQ